MRVRCLNGECWVCVCWVLWCGQFCTKMLFKWRLKMNLIVQLSDQDESNRLNGKSDSRWCQHKKVKNSPKSTKALQKFTKTQPIHDPYRMSREPCFHIFGVTLYEFIEQAMLKHWCASRTKIHLNKTQNYMTAIDLVVLIRWLHNKTRSQKQEEEK